jgi:hypothetical protein
VLIGLATDFGIFRVVLHDDNKNTIENRIIIPFTVEKKLLPIF